MPGEGPGSLVNHHSRGHVGGRHIPAVAERDPQLDKQEIRRITRDLTDSQRARMGLRSSC